MTLSRLHRTLRHPYYVMAPDYTEASGGIQSLHYLCHALNLEGADAYLASARHTQAGLKTPLLTDEILQRHVAAGLQPIAIYPEIVTGNPLGATVCVRYMLNKEGLLNGNRTEAGPDDLHVYYRDEFRDPARPGPLLRLPMIDVTLFSPEPVQPRTVDLLYLNRVPRSAVDFSTLPAGIQVLCLDDPLPLPALADLLRRARVFYSYEASGTCSLAVFCGCPVVARVAPGYERYAITEQGVEDLGGGIAWHDDPASLQAALAQAGHARERYAQVETLFWQQLDIVIADTQQRADRAEAAARRDPMATWLESRRFDAHQHARIAEYLQQHGGGPSLLVLVRDPGGDTDAVAATLRSLDAAASPFRNLSAHVVGR
ncbi:glycosyl transferase family 2, partial [Xanthomonas sp. Kuri4-2]